jgi:hypothetical protein
MRFEMKSADTSISDLQSLKTAIMWFVVVMYAQKLLLKTINQKII